jgi:hypothetical protein
MREALSLLRDAMSQQGRDPAQLRIVPMGVVPDEAKLAYYRESGATEAVLRLPSASREEVLPRLDQFARFTAMF